MEGFRVLEIKKSVFENNDREADKLRQAAIVAGAEREQRYILTAGIFEKRLPLFCQKLWRFCSYRSVNMSGLAEAAAANAAAEQLEVHSVVNDLG